MSSVTHSFLLNNYMTTNSLGHKAAVVLAGSAALAISAQIMVPMYPIPMTMQTLVVLLLGAALGSRLGLAAVCAYLLEGCMGLPVFSGGMGGMVAFLSPTLGYKLGFIPAVWIAGRAAAYGKDRSFVTALPWLAVAHQSIFVFGLAWLAFGMGLGIEQAFTVGYLPFFGADIIKFSLAAVLLPAAWKYLPKLR